MEEEEKEQEEEEEGVVEEERVEAVDLSFTMIVVAREVHGDRN